MNREQRQTSRPKHSPCCSHTPLEFFQTMAEELYKRLAENGTFPNALSIDDVRKKLIIEEIKENMVKKNPDLMSLSPEEAEKRMFEPIMRILDILKEANH